MSVTCSYSNLKYTTSKRGDVTALPTVWLTGDLCVVRWIKHHSNACFATKCHQNKCINNNKEIKDYRFEKCFWDNFSDSADHEKWGAKYLESDPNHAYFWPYRICLLTTCSSLSIIIEWNQFCPLSLNQTVFTIVISVINGWWQGISIWETTEPVCYLSLREETLPSVRQWWMCEHSIGSNMFAMIYLFWHTHADI